MLLETTGRHSGRPRQVPLARGPVDGSIASLIAVHGPHASFARNVAADPRVRLRLAGRWRSGTAALAPLDTQMLRRFNRYARAGPRTVGIDPQLVRIELDDTGSRCRPTRCWRPPAGGPAGRGGWPIANGLQDDTFWLIAGLGNRAAYVHNLRSNPRVRIRARPARLRDGVRTRRRTGTAHPLPDDDARARHRQLGRGRPGYLLDGLLLRGLGAGQDMLTIRIDLD